jgi:hypothetical protein
LAPRPFVAEGGERIVGFQQFNRSPSVTIEHKHPCADDPALVKGSVLEPQREGRAEQQAGPGAHPPSVDDWDNWKSARDVA